MRRIHQTLGRCVRFLLPSLPPERFSHGDWKHAKVNIDYHVEVDKHYYSVPHALVHEKVEIRFYRHSGRAKTR